MKLPKMLLVVLVVFFLISPAAEAGDFDWIKDFNIQVEADPSGFRVKLATRFKIGDLEVKTVLSSVENPADAYVLLRLGEMSEQPTDHVIEEYRSSKDKGWGALAKSLGIKPGSEEFHALKRGQDLYPDSGEDKDKAKGKGRKGKGKGGK